MRSLGSACKCGCGQTRLIVRIMQTRSSTWQNSQINHEIEWSSYFPSCSSGVVFLTLCSSTLPLKRVLFECKALSRLGVWSHPPASLCISLPKNTSINSSPWYLTPNSPPELGYWRNGAPPTDKRIAIFTWFYAEHPTRYETSTPFSLIIKHVEQWHEVQFNKWKREIIDPNIDGCLFQTLTGQYPFYPFSICRLLRQWSYTVLYVFRLGTQVFQDHCSWIFKLRNAWIRINQYRARTRGRSQLLPTDTPQTHHRHTHTVQLTGEPLLFCCGEYGSEISSQASAKHWLSMWRADEILAVDIGTDIRTGGSRSN